MARAGKAAATATKTESIQLPDGEIDTETLSPVSLYNCINSFLPFCSSFYHISLGRRCPITISWSHCSLKEFWDDLLSHGAARSLSPVIEGPDPRGGATAPHRNRNCPWSLTTPARRFPELRSQAARPVRFWVTSVSWRGTGGVGGW